MPDTSRSAILAGLLALAACATPSRQERAAGGPAPAPAADAGPAAAPGAPAKREIVVRVDPRIELLCILNLLAGASEYDQALPTPYLKDVREHFAPFKDHPAVKMSAELRRTNGIGFNAPIGLAVYLDPATLAPIRPLTPLPPDLDERWRGVALDKYLAAVRDFAAKTHYREFVTAHRDEYEAVEDRFRELLRPVDMVSWFDGFFGKRPGATYILSPGMLTGSANYGATAVRPDGTEAIYQVVSIAVPNEHGQQRATIALVAHELAHAYVNPLVAAHTDVLDPAVEPLYRMVENRMKQQAYGTVQTVTDESCVRAVTILFLRDRIAEDAAQKDMARQEDRGFLWIRGLVGTLERFRRQRDQYASLDDYVPELTAFFSSWAREHRGAPPVIPFRGPINSVFFRFGVLDSALTVVGPGGRTRATKNLAAYARKVRDQMLAKAALVDGARKAWKDLPKTPLVLYGSPRSNRALKELLGKLGWRVTGKAVDLGAGLLFQGEHLVLIACHPHPDNPNVGVVLYAAASDADLTGINALFHGPTDFVVARRLPDGKYKVLAAGDFPKTPRGEWPPGR